ncbi:MAG: YaiI/YqxD family protein, partial [Myxococcota bacterium]
DADACPRPVKEMLFRAADRVPIEVILVANQPLRLPKSKWVRLEVVGKGFDVADEWIAEQVQDGDLVITADVPLAAAAVENGGIAIDPRGQVTDASNAASRLTMRNFMEEQREAMGELLGGPKPYSDRDKRNFAGALDRWLARRPRG